MAFDPGDDKEVMETEILTRTYFQILLIGQPVVNCPRAEAKWLRLWESPLVQCNYTIHADDQRQSNAAPQPVEPGGQAREDNLTYSGAV